MQTSLDDSEIRAAEKVLERALESSDPAAWVYHYTEDAVFVSPGAPAVQGRTALRNGEGHAAALLRSDHTTADRSIR